MALDRPRTNSNLSNFSAGPAYRGAVEKVDLVAIRGWCLAAEDPTRPVALDVECEGVRLGQVLTFAPRKELSERLGASVNAGLAFHWAETSTEARQALIEALATASEPDQPISLSLPIRDSEPPLELDTSWAGRNGHLPSRAELLKHLKSTTSRPRQTLIAQRESLLRSLPQPHPQTVAPRLRALAFYLPQFHPVAENDEWWGPGFTEWSSVSTARPLFQGHEQPRIPADLGYYDLRTPGVIEQQIELARSHGLAGFCFHYYWFSGQRLLERPLQRFLEIDHDFGFCLCWANEPWSRRWDGSEKEVLVAQEHRLDGDVAFIHEVLPLLKDPRYIRVGGKPLLIVYRVPLLSDPAQVFERWRQICVDAGLPGLQVCMAESFGETDPHRHGCDSSVEFPPHGVSARPIQNEPARVPGLDPQFSGKIFDYGEVLANRLAADEPSHPRYKTLMLGWDNTSRRGSSAHVFANFTPELMELWLEDACERTERRFRVEDERLVFINAWNEWGEGTYLEPDRRHGRRYLEVLRDVLHGRTSPEASVALLRQKLAGDAQALAAVERLGARIRCLEQTAGQALSLAWRSTPRVAESVLSPAEPLGLTPLRPGGMGLIERLGAQRRARHCVLRRGQFLSCSGWAVPGDRAQQEFTPSYLRFAPLDTQLETHYGFVYGRVQREDVVGLTRTDKRQSLWSGFAFCGTTEALVPGRYAVSMVFPAAGSDIGSAIEIGSDCTIEILP